MQENIGFQGLKEKPSPQIYDQSHPQACLPEAILCRKSFTLRHFLEILKNESILDQI